MSERPNSRNAEEEFKDPLENYEPPAYEDPLERALVEQTVAAIQSSPFTSIPPETTIAESVRMLAEREIRCLLVAEDDRLVGIFSERDVLDRVADEYERIQHEPIRSVMTSDPVAVHTNDSAAAALCAMAIGGYRHVPVLDVDGKLAGIVGPRRVTEFLKSHFADE